MTPVPDTIAVAGSLDFELPPDRAFRDQFDVGVERKLGEIETLIGHPFVWPCTTDDATDRAVQLGYDADRNSLHYLLRRQQLDDPPQQGKRVIMWTRGNFASAVRALEASRLWIPESQHHVHKMTFAERDEGVRKLREARAALQPMLERFAGQPVRHVVQALADESADVRAFALALMIARARSSGWPLSPVVQQFAAMALSSSDAAVRAEAAAGVERMVEATIGADAMDARVEPEPIPVEPSAEVRGLSNIGALEILDQLADDQGLTHEQRETLVDAMALAVGRRSPQGVDPAPFLALLPGALQGDTDAIAAAREWVTLNPLVATGEDQS